MAENRGQQRAWHMTSLGSFNVKAAIADLASRAGGSGFRSTSNDQIMTWEGTLTLLEQVFTTIIGARPEADRWAALFEFEIPRRQRRIDMVLIAGGVVFSIEIKHGSERFSRSDRLQAEDYALDLRDFHSESRGRTLVPVLWSTASTAQRSYRLESAFEVLCVGKDGLAEAILEIHQALDCDAGGAIEPATWDRGLYRPVPTIIEAAQRLYGGHEVADISHSYADNLTSTVDAVSDEIDFARTNGCRTICFITGVPGAGKTLAGLVASNAAQKVAGDEACSAYLSGNGPLVRVLREALAQDAHAQGEKLGEARRRVETLVQNVHEFVREYAIKRPDAAPQEHVIVFDEAQRAWHAQKMTKRHPTLTVSEPALVLDIMERVADWAVVVALVGGGQEIHTGEAGIEEWGRAIESAQALWRVVASPEVLRGGDSVASHRLFQQGADRAVLVESPALHLGVSVRSPRAKHLAIWVNSVLGGRPDEAAASLKQIDGFRIGMTRDLDLAKSWLRDVARDERRCGLLSSSGNLRLRAYGLEVSPEFLNGCSLEHWFFAGPSDIRSSSALEIAMTEFKVQGLELDYCGVCWGDDLTIDKHGDWELRRFSGASWRSIKDAASRRYLFNKYRVLLTRARAGMVIFVPPGDRRDLTRDPARLDRTAQYLARCGLTDI